MFSKLLRPYYPPRNLRSTEFALLDIPTTKLKTFGNRTFGAVAPKLWNSLSLEVRELEKLCVCKSAIRTLLFKEHYGEV